jgi:cyclophilin family peptidyl-prolyl cis-trans isomerase
VGTEKRERQKANRQVRLAELEKQQRRSNTRKRAIRIAVIVVLAVAAAFGLSRLISSGNESVSASDTTGPGTIPGETVPTSSSASTSSVPPTVPGKSITGTTPCPAADGSSARASKFQNPPPMCIDPAKTYTAVVDTDKGKFTVALDAKKAPKTVNNFVVLSRYHFYDGLTFHRVVPGFVVQGGDPEGTGGGGPGYTFQDELPASLSDYKTGSVAMANSGPNTNGSQFFVTLADNGLDGPKYSLFGHVTEGFDTTVKALEAEGAAGQTPYIKSVTITES